MQVITYKQEALPNFQAISEIIYQEHTPDQYKMMLSDLVGIMVNIALPYAEYNDVFHTGTEIAAKMVAFGYSKECKSSLTGFVVLENCDLVVYRNNQEVMNINAEPKSLLVVDKQFRVDVSDSDVLICEIDNLTAPALIPFKVPRV